MTKLPCLPPSAAPVSTPRGSARGAQIKPPASLNAPSHAKGDSACGGTSGQRDGKNPAPEGTTDKAAGPGTGPDVPPAPHPLAQALLDVLDATAALQTCCSNGQAHWILHPSQRTGRKPAISARFTPLPNATAHQKMAHAHGLAILETLLHRITPAMDTVPALAGAPFQWDIGFHPQGASKTLRLCYGQTVVASGDQRTVARAIVALVDTLAMLPPHGGRVFAVGLQRYPAASPADLLVLYTAMEQAGLVTAEGLEQAYDALHNGSLAEVFFLEPSVLDRARAHIL